MNPALIQRNWNITKRKLKEKYAQLTDDDLIYVEGEEAQLLARIQLRTARPRHEIESYLRDECGCQLVEAPLKANPAEPETDQPLRAFGRSYMPGLSDNPPWTRRGPDNRAARK